MRYIRYYLLFSLIGSIAFSATAQVPIDSAGYEAQRQRINELLNERSARFGKFDESIKKRTGIFGLKTKRDMQSSIDILKQIVQMDNHILRETKVLLDYKESELDYKEFERSRIEELARDYDNRINGYIQTISKLQKEQTTSHEKVQAAERSKQFFRNLFFLMLACLVGGGIWVGTRWQKLTQK